MAYKGRSVEQKESMKQTTQEQITGSDGGRGCCSSSRSTSRGCGCSGDPCRDHGSVMRCLSILPLHVQNMITNLLANGRKATSLAALVHRLRDPVDPGVAADLQ